MNKKFRYWVIAVAILFIAALIAILFGIFSHKEAGLLNVCWADNRANYTTETEQHKTSCLNPVPLTWPTDHLFVAVVDNDRVIVDDNRADVIWDSIKVVNAQLHTKLARARQISKAHIIVIIDAAYDLSTRAGLLGDVPGYCKHIKSNNKMIAHMAVRPGSVSEQLYVASHEFGHCLGLAHDINNEASVMFPVADTDISEVKMILFSDHDISLMRKLYP